MERKTPHSDAPNEFRLCEQRYFYVDEEALPFSDTGFYVLQDSTPIAYVFCADDPTYNRHFFIYSLRDAELSEMAQSQDIHPLADSSAVLLLTGGVDTPAGVICTLFSPVEVDVELTNRTSIPDSIKPALESYFRAHVPPQKAPDVKTVLLSNKSRVRKVLGRFLNLGGPKKS